MLTRSGTPPRAIGAIGLSGQMHGAVLLDDAGSVLRPAIIWCDQRTAQECRWLDEHVGAARLLELTSNPALTNFTLTKLLWVRRHEPEVWRRVRHVLLPKDYVRYRLSGEYAIDVADASGTLMLDVVRRRWSGECWTAAIDPAVMPALFESPEVCARLSDAARSATGLPAGLPIVAGAGDQAAGAVGMGITRPGTVSATIGTSGVVFAATDRPFLDPRGRLHTFCHAIPDRWHVMGVTQAAGLSLRWLRDQVGRAADGDRAYDDLIAEASAVAPGSDGVLWAPYLMGERTPHLAYVRAGSSPGREPPRGKCCAAVPRCRVKPARLVHDIRRLGLPSKKFVSGGCGARCRCAAIRRTSRAGGGNVGDKKGRVRRALLAGVARALAFGGRGCATPSCRGAGDTADHYARGGDRAVTPIPWGISRPARHLPLEEERPVGRRPASISTTRRANRPLQQTHAPSIIQAVHASAPRWALPRPASCFGPSSQSGRRLTDPSASRRPRRDMPGRPRTVPPGSGGRRNRSPTATNARSTRRSNRFAQWDTRPGQDLQRVPEKFAGDGYVGCSSERVPNGDCTSAFRSDSKRAAAGITTSGDLTVAAATAKGAVAKFTAIAKEKTDGDRPVTCQPASGSTFPVGKTTVSCWAVSSLGKLKQTTLAVTVTKK